ncbi:ankyrin repeat and LEM domain-containing protein 1-like [Schistocerca serialis cubense]|uniref:ankyrin repeat and LEM domain-containing protein 1-like n=1 Tax=Schistocerca serialis cubense TaxID=2023355 RepID=UPI00214EE409|nr:ankyrin repeat and LEM domain-containing protein 1-like [Schistocerca serialis cubense]
MPVTDTGWTALHSAAQEGKEGAAQRLLFSMGSHVNAQDADGCSALHVAAAWGRAGVLRELLAAGADVALRMADGRSARDLAQQTGHFACAKLLSKHERRMRRRGLATLSATLGVDTTDTCA